MKLEKRQDKIAALMIEDLRRILRKEADELLLPVYVQPIRELQSLNHFTFAGKMPLVSELPGSMNIVYYPSSSGINSYDLDPMPWRAKLKDWFDRWGL